jgi:hypothetical protein
MISSRLDSRKYPASLKGLRQVLKDAEDKVGTPDQSVRVLVNGEWLKIVGFEQTAMRDSGEVNYVTILVVDKSPEGP